MPNSVNISRLQRRRKLLFAAFAMVVVLTLSFGIWLYKAKNQSDLNRQLLSAVSKKDSAAAQSALSRGADPNAMDVPQNLTLWQQVRSAFHTDNRRDIHRYSALEQALKSSFDEGRRVDTVNVPLVEALLDAGARPNDCSHYGISPLMRAVGRGSLPTMQALIDHGANPVAQDLTGRYPIDFMTANDSNALRIAELLVKLSNNANASDRAGMTPLMHNLMHPANDDRVVQFLAAQGANVDARSELGFTALTIALSTNSVEAARFLLERGADANICGHNNKSPLAWAAEMGEAREVGLLLNHGAKVDAINRNGDTPLIYCVSFCNSLGADMPTSLEIMRLLIDHGADISHRNKEGDSALSLAKKVNWGEAIELLEAAGARR